MWNDAASLKDCQSGTPGSVWDPTWQNKTIDGVILIAGSASTILDSILASVTDALGASLPTPTITKVVQETGFVRPGTAAGFEQ